MDPFRQGNITESSYRRCRLKNKNSSSDCLIRALKFFGNSGKSVTYETQQTDREKTPAIKIRIKTQRQENSTSRNVRLSYQEDNPTSNSKVGKILKDSSVLNVPPVLLESQTCKGCQNLQKTQGNFNALKKQFDKVYLENVRLHKENSQLAEAFRQMEQNGGTQVNINECSKLKQTITQMAADLKQKSHSEQQLMKQVRSLDCKVELLYKQLQNKQNMLIKKMEEIVKLKKTKQQQKEEMMELREIALMSRQELLSEKAEIINIRKLLKKFRDEKLKQLQDIKKCQQEAFRVQATQKSRIKDLTNELHIFNTVVGNVKSHYIRDINPINQNSQLQAYNKCEVTPDQSELYKFQAQDAERSIDMSVFDSCKPTFFSIVSHEYQMLGYDRNSLSKLHQDPITEDTRNYVLSQIRFIYDCMLRCFDLDQNLRNVKEFPQFVYCWLEMYDIEKKTKQLKQRKKEMGEANRCRFQFYIGVMNESFNDSWEVVTFRQFLLEAHSFEQLYCYLKMRKHLLRYDVSTAYKAHVGCQLDIPVDRIDSLLTNYVPFLDKISMTYLKNLLRSNVTYINRIKMINSAFVLRVCLQYWKIHRVQQYKAILKQFEQLSVILKQQNISTYHEFIALVTIHYTSLTEHERIRLYRQCYMHGGGSISPNIVYYVFQNQRIFLKEIVKEFVIKENKFQVLQYDPKILTAVHDLADRIDLKDKEIQRFLGSIGYNLSVDLRKEEIVQQGVALLCNKIQKGYKMICYSLRNSLNEQTISNAIETVKLLVDTLEKGYNMSIMREECRKAFDYAKVRNLVRCLEKSHLTKLDEFYNTVTKKMFEAKSIVRKRRAPRRERKTIKMLD